MRLISTLGLTLLLVFAIGATAHGSADVTAAGTTSIAGDPAVTSADSVTTVDSAPQAAATSTQFDPAAGALLCVLGILCGLLAAILIYRLVWRRPVTLAEATVTHTAIRATKYRQRPRRVSLSLATLGIART